MEVLVFLLGQDKVRLRIVFQDKGILVPTLIYMRVLFLRSKYGIPGVIRIWEVKQACTILREVHNADYIWDILGRRVSVLLSASLVPRCMKYILWRKLKTPWTRWVGNARDSTTIAVANNAPITIWVYVCMYSQ